MFTLDTNPIVYYAKDESAVVNRLEMLVKADIPRISTITEIELFSRKNIPQDEVDRIGVFLQYVWIVPPDSRIARIAAQVRREHNLKIGDAVIAATALSLGSTLVTRNIKDFRRVPGLSIEAI